MSFVSIIVSKNFINVMSDGKVTGVNGNPDLESYKKFKKISNKQFIAFTGSKEPCEEIIKNVKYINNRKYNLREISLQIQSVIKGQNFNIQMAVGGIDLDNNLRVYVISSIGGITDILESQSHGNLKYKFLTSGQIVREYTPQQLDVKFNKYFDELGGKDTSRSLFKVQKRLNNYIADIDKTVNKKIFRLTIN